MNFKVHLKGIIKMSKYLFYGIILQSTLSTLLLASTPSKGQMNVNHYKSVSRIILDFDQQELTLKDAFRFLQDQTGLKFAYVDSKIPIKNKVTLDANKNSLEHVLLGISKEAGVAFTRINQRIVVSKSKQKVKNIKIQEIFQDEKVISGKVTDKENGEGLAGVNVILPGSSIGTISDIDGNYSISIPVNRDSLSFSFIGYAAKIVAIGDKSVVNVALSTDIKELQEVMVTAMGIERESKTMGYSIEKVEGEELQSVNAPTVASGLVGKVSGLMVTTTSGGVNASPRLLLRGVRSVVGNNEPLIVIDGIPVDNESINNPGGFGDRVDVGSRINDINPNDVEKVTVLKGPSAAALYGSRAANGAIIITTKQGTTSEPEVSVGSALTFQKTNLLFEPQEKFGNGFGGEYIHDEVYNYGDAFDGSIRPVGPVLEDGSQQELPYEYIGDAHMKDFFETGTTWQNNFSVGGRTDNGSYYVSASHTDTKGTVPEDEFARTTVRFNGTTFFSDKLNVKANLSYNKNDMNVSHPKDVYFWVMQNPGHIPITKYKDWENDKFSTPVGFWSGHSENVYAEIGARRFISNLHRFIGSVELNYDAFDWLSLQYRIGTDISTDNRKSAFEEIRALNKVPYRRYPYSQHGQIHESNQFISELNSDLIITAQQKLTSDINARLILGQNLRQRYTRSLNMSNDGLVVERDFHHISNTSGTPNLSENQVNKRLVGFYGDLQLDYQDYLFLNITGRNDISSTLPKDKNSYFYPSVSLSFIPTSAIAAIDHSPVLSFAKIRASASQVGNDADAYLLEPSFWNGHWSPYGNTTTFEVSGTIASENLSPEFTTSLEAGLDLGFLEDRISLNSTLFKTITTDQIVTVTVPPTTGFYSSVINIGKTKGWGYELDFSVYPFRNLNGLTWKVGANYSFFENELVELGLDTESIGVSYLAVAQEGENFPALRTSAYKRDPLGRLVVDPKTGGTLNADESKVFGPVNPKHMLGINTNINYKGLSLSGLLEYRGGNKFFSWTAWETFSYGKAKITESGNRERVIIPNSVIEVSDGVFEENTSVATQYDNESFWWYSVRNAGEGGVIDGSFIKLREIALHYDLPVSLLQNLPFKKVSLGIVGQNLFVWLPEANKYADPEANFYRNQEGGGLEFRNLPPNRNFGFNINMTF